MILKNLNYESVRPKTPPYERPLHICGSLVRQLPPRKLLSDIRWCLGIALVVSILLAIAWFVGELDQSLSHWNVDGPQSANSPR
jgi:hypothetical protein